jgi:CubicO group peptidase (beta-lactamase class C family)
MRRAHFVLIATIATVATAAFPTGTRAGSDLRSLIDSVITQRVAADSFSGVVAVARQGTVIYQRAAGMANAGTAVPMTVDTRLQIASMTKLFTNIAIRQLEQAGKLSLTDTVGKFLPSYPNAAVRSKVTVDQLLRHRSGIGSFWNERFMARHADIRTVQDYLELFQTDSLAFEPGTKEAYSNGGYVVLGAIIERASGMSYHEYLREHVFAPALMTETVPFDRKATITKAAIGYTRQPTGGSVRRPNSEMQPGVSGPAGDHFSTVGDFLELARAITTYRLLDSAHTIALLGQRYATGSDFRSNGGGPGVNGEFSIFPSGDVLIVLSNYDPPAATSIAQFVRALLQPAPAR